MKFYEIWFRQGNRSGAKLNTAIRTRGSFGFVVALRPQTPKHIRGGWSHYTDNSEPVDGEVQL
jgi:hypothetical protein